ncbi:hypothetical protein Kpho02_77630 [Kitasatospora phosalacinea]|uniref:Uncharacterized protein n=1 Tax=Kitasatospora phosalacinea TaxID=2065 RepID=A0A9W6V577_9ACTN|nr:hypothetical protein [Kitasatospora phosalacinea]GLW75466.1 hypothetical protein Kpho02_77630 [Kitasatospora phosalacinea]
MAEADKGTTGRAGAPWGPLKGPTPEANHLAATLRQWLDASDLRVKDFHAQLEPVDFGGGKVPSPDTVYSRFAGIKLDWNFVSAVVQVCSADEDTRATRLKQGRQMLNKAVEAARVRRESERVRRRAGLPPVQVPPALPAPGTDSLPPGPRLLAAQDKIIQMYEKQSTLQQANHRLELIVALAAAKEQEYLRDIADLERRLADALAARTSEPAQIALYEKKIEEARAREEAMANARYDAEDDRDIARQMLGHANQEIADLKAEIDRLKTVFGVTTQRIVERVGDVLGDRLQIVDGAIDAVQRIVGEEHDQLREMGRSLGWSLPEDQKPSGFDGRTIPGEVLYSEPDNPPSTPDNPPTSQDTALSRPDNPPARPDNPAAGHTPPTPWAASPLPQTPTPHYPPPAHVQPTPTNRPPVLPASATTAANSQTRKSPIWRKRLQSAATLIGLATLLVPALVGLTYLDHNATTYLRAPACDSAATPPVTSNCTTTEDAVVTDKQKGGTDDSDKVTVRRTSGKTSTMDVDHLYNAVTQGTSVTLTLWEGHIIKAHTGNVTDDVYDGATLWSVPVIVVVGFLTWGLLAALLEELLDMDDTFVAGGAVTAGLILITASMNNEYARATSYRVSLILHTSLWAALAFIVGLVSIAVQMTPTERAVRARYRAQKAAKNQR